MPELPRITARLTPSMTVGPGHPLAFILGPCVIESPEHTLRMASALRELASELGVLGLAARNRFRASVTMRSMFTGTIASSPPLWRPKTS